MGFPQNVLASKVKIYSQTVSWLFYGFCHVKMIHLTDVLGCKCGTSSCFGKMVCSPMIKTPEPKFALYISHIVRFGPGQQRKESEMLTGIFGTICNVSTRPSVNWLRQTNDTWVIHWQGQHVHQVNHSTRHPETSMSPFCLQLVSTWHKTTMITSAQSPTSPPWARLFKKC